jgi:hypothetical protein
MVKPALVLVLVAGLLLAATPAALAVESPSSSISADNHPSSFPQLSSSLPSSDLDCIEESEVSESDSIKGFLDGGRLCEQAVPAFHLRSTHASDAYRSRAPAVVHGRSPPR